LTSGVPWPGAALAGAGVTLQGALGAGALRRLSFQPTLDSLRDLLLLWGVGGALGSLVSASLGIAALGAAGTIVPSFRAWATWYLGDAVGVWLIGPFLLSVVARPMARPLPVRVFEILELVALLATTALAVRITFDPSAGYPYLPFLPLIWAALRFDLRVTSFLAVFVGLFAVWETAHGHTQFAGTSLHEAVLQTYRFIVAFGTVGSVLSTVMEGQRRMIHDLRASEARFRTVFKNSPVPKVILSVELERLVDANDAWLDLFGVPREEIIGARLSDLGFWNQLDGPDRLQALIARGPVRNFEAQLHNRHGKVYTGLISAEGCDIAGKPYVLATFQDLTAYRELQQQLFQAQKAETIGRFASGIAHDFNNVLTAITGHIDLGLAALDEGDPRREEFLGARHAADRAAALTRQLLAFGRRHLVEQRILDLNPLVSSMQPMLGRLLPKNITLVFASDEQPCLVRADPVQLEQVILNLVVNSRDAMPNGGTIKLETAAIDLDPGGDSAHQVLLSGPYVILSVSDTGVGMSIEVQQRIFESMFTTKPVGKGSGLGLSVVHEIVQQAGGDVAVVSEPGVGTTMKVYLPRVVEATGAPSHAAEPQT
jgi:PAS domain S-box-containing protein